MLIQKILLLFNVIISTATCLNVAVAIIKIPSFRRTGPYWFITGASVAMGLAIWRITPFHYFDSLPPLLSASFCYFCWFMTSKHYLKSTE